MGRVPPSDAAQTWAVTSPTWATKKASPTAAARPREVPEEVRSVADLSADHFDDDLWDVVRTCTRTAETFEKVGETLEISLLVRHALAVAAAFHHLYHTHPILQAPDEESRRSRRAALQLVALHLQDVLAVLGVPVPERM